MGKNKRAGILATGVALAAGFFGSGNAQEVNNDQDLNPVGDNNAPSATVLDERSQNLQEQAVEGKGDVGKTFQYEVMDGDTAQSLAYFNKLEDDVFQGQSLEEQAKHVKEMSSFVENVQKLKDLQKTGEDVELHGLGDKNISDLSNEELVDLAMEQNVDPYGSHYNNSDYIPDYVKGSVLNELNENHDIIGENATSPVGHAIAQHQQSIDQAYNVKMGVEMSDLSREDISQLQTYLRELDNAENAGIDVGEIEPPTFVLQHASLEDLDKQQEVARESLENKAHWLSSNEMEPENQREQDEPELS